jgi:site-specific DNA-methyltransferase (adenine-specific)
MMQLIEEKSFLSDLISPRRDSNRPVFNWHAFKHSYSLELVNHLIADFKLSSGQWVLDPFCGGGTTLLACKQAGINCHGFDILPFSVLLTNVKTRNYNLRKIKNEYKRIETARRNKKNTHCLPDIPIAQKAFSIQTRKELLRIKQCVESIKDKRIKDFFNIAFLSILEGVSQTKKAGGFLRLVKRDVQTGGIYPAFLQKLQSMILDLENTSASNAMVSAFRGDARNLPTESKYDAVITSPPYPNRHDYTRIYSLEMLFDFVSTNDDLKKIRYETLRSHVEAKKKYEAQGYVESKKLAQLINKIKVNGVNNPQVVSMLRGYFEDMFLVCKEIYRCLHIGGKVAIVIGNVRFSGVNIPVDEILAEIGEQVGLSTRNIWVARYRGNSSQQMKTYMRKPSRESIVFWNK